MLNYDYPESARFRVIFRDGVQTLRISDIVDLYDVRFIDRVPLSGIGEESRFLGYGDKLQTYDPLIKSHKPNTIIIRVS